MTGRRACTAMLVLAFLGNMTPARGADVETRTAERLERARDNLRSKDYKAALRAAESALADAPANTSAHLLAARALVELGRTDEAIGHLEDALRIEPGKKGLYSWIGSLRMQQAAVAKPAENAASAFAKAASDFEQELRVDPTSIDALAGRAISLSRAGHTDTAIEAHRVWIAASPGQPEAYVSLVGLLAAVNRPAEELIAVREHVPPASPATRAEVDLAIGKALLDRGESERALASLTSAASAAPSEAGFHALLAVAYTKAKMHEEAWEEIERFVAAAPSLAERRRHCSLFPDSFWPRLEDAPSHGGEGKDLGADARAPELVSKVKPAYPEIARRARLEGRATLRAVLTREGQVSVVCVDASNPIFEPPAVAAVEQWRYKPATIGGKPTPVWFTLVVDFRLE